MPSDGSHNVYLHGENAPDDRRAAKRARRAEAQRLYLSRKNGAADARSATSDGGGSLFSAGWMYTEDGDIHSFCEDSTIYARLAALAGMLALGFYLVALVLPNWSVADKIDFGTGGLAAVTEATFGLRRYCLKVPVPALGGDHFACHPYDAVLHVAGENGTWENATGCDRFPDVCEKSQTVTALLVVSSVAAFVGAVFSEHMKLNGLCCGIAGLGGLIGMSIWVSFQDSLDSDNAARGNLEAGPGLGLVVGAWLLSAIAAVAAALDCGDHDIGAFIQEKLASRPPDADGDDDGGSGIRWQGRLGSALSVAAWGLCLVALLLPDWSTTAELGTAGGFCDSDNATSTAAACPFRGASFGVHEYCLETEIPLFGSAHPAQVCLGYDEATVTNGQPGQTGESRFSDLGLRQKLDACYANTLIAVISAAISDLFSEMLPIGSSLCLVAAVSGLCGMISWLVLDSELDAAVAAGTDLDAGLFVVLGGWLAAAAAAGFYFVNWNKRLDIEYAEPDYAPRRSKGQQHQPTTQHPYTAQPALGSHGDVVGRADYAHTGYTTGAAAHAAYTHTTANQPLARQGAGAGSGHIIGTKGKRGIRVYKD